MKKARARTVMASAMIRFAAATARSSGRLSAPSSTTSRSRAAMKARNSE
jgi:hypothetical protein